MEAGNVEIGLMHLQLLQNVVPHLSRRTRRERGNGQLRETRSQPAELPVVRPEFVSPLGNAMRLVDRKETDWNLRQPSESILRGQPLRRKIKQPIFAARSFLH